MCFIIKKQVYFLHSPLLSALAIVTLGRNHYIYLHKPNFNLLDTQSKLPPPPKLTNLLLPLTKRLQMPIKFTKLTLDLLPITQQIRKPILPNQESQKPVEIFFVDECCGSRALAWRKVEEVVAGEDGGEAPSPAEN